MSYTSIFTSLSTIISALSGMMFWNENLEWSHVVGIALMLVSFVLAVDKRADKNGFSWRWLLLCIVCFFTTGAIGVMQKAHQSSVYRPQLGAFLIVAFAVSFLT
jgi:drug/metabolite transporter (DMT)-like permease